VKSKELFKRIKAIKKNQETIFGYIEDGELEKLEKFLGENPGINLNFFYDNEISPLHYAVAIGKSRIVELLLENGANINIRGRNGLQPIHLCADIVTLRLLLANKVDVNAQDHAGWSALHHAIFSNNLNIFQELVKSANINLKNYANETPKDFLISELYRRGEELGCKKDAVKNVSEYYAKLAKEGKLTPEIDHLYTFFDYMGMFAITQKELEVGNIRYAPTKKDLQNVFKRTQDAYNKAMKKIKSDYENIVKEEQDDLLPRDEKNKKLLFFISTTLGVVYKYHNPLTAFLADTADMTPEEIKLAEAFALTQAAGALRMVIKLIHILPGELRGKYLKNLPFKSNPWHRIEAFGKTIVPLGFIDNKLDAGDAGNIMLISSPGSENQKKAIARLINDLKQIIPVTEFALADIIKEDVLSLQKLFKYMYGEALGVGIPDIGEIKLDNIAALTSHDMTNEAMQRLLLWTTRGSREVYRVDDHKLLTSGQYALSATFNGENCNFAMQSAKGDGDCGFRSLLGGEFLQGEINRDEIIARINRVIDDVAVDSERSQKVINLVAIDIEQRYQEYEPGENELEEYFPEELKVLFDTLKGQEQSSLLTGAEREEFYRSEIKSNFSKKDHVKSYLNNYLTGHEHYKSVWPMLGGVMDAAAECLDKKVHYWHMRNGKLEAMHSNWPTNVTEEIHVIHIGVHFDRLLPSLMPVDIFKVELRPEFTPDSDDFDFDFALALQMSYDRIKSVSEPDESVQNDFIKQLQREQKALASLRGLNKSSYVKLEDLGFIHPESGVLKYTVDQIGFGNNKQKHALLRRLQNIGEFLNEQHMPSSVKDLVEDIDLTSFRTLRDAISHPWDRNYHRILGNILADPVMLKGIRDDLCELNKKILLIAERRYDALPSVDNDEEMWQAIKANYGRKKPPASKDTIAKNDFVPGQNLLSDDEITQFFSYLRQPTAPFLKDAKNLDEVKLEYQEILCGRKECRDATPLQQYFPSKKENSEGNKNCLQLFDKMKARLDELFRQKLKEAAEEKSKKKGFAHISEVAKLLNSPIEHNSKPSKVRKLEMALEALENLKTLLRDDIKVIFSDTRDNCYRDDPEMYGRAMQKISQDSELKYALEYNLYNLLEMTLAVTKYRESDASLKDRALQIEMDRKRLVHGDVVLDSIQSPLREVISEQERSLFFRILGYIYDLEPGLRNIERELRPTNLVSRVRVEGLDLSRVALTSKSDNWIEKMLNAKGPKGVSKEI
jgi:hypothetical protein